MPNLYRSVLLILFSIAIALLIKVDSFFSNNKLKRAAVPLNEGKICSTLSEPYTNQHGDSIPNPRCAPTLGLVCPEGSCCSSNLQ